jgi:hypothetical protein
MKAIPYRTIATAVLILAGAICWFSWSRRNDADDQREASSHSSQTENRSGNKTVSSSTRPTASHQASAAAPATLSTNEMLELIHEASVTYDAAELPTIRPYLSHADPEIRKAAVDAMIVLGDSSAAVMLRDAASNAHTPQEAVDMLKAAEYLELPSATEIRRRKSK